MIPVYSEVGKFFLLSGGGGGGARAHWKAASYIRPSRAPYRRDRRRERTLSVRRGYPSVLGATSILRARTDGKIKRQRAAPDDIVRNPYLRITTVAGPEQIILLDDK